MATQGKAKLLTKRLVITSLIAVLLLVVANSAIWVNRQIFDTQNFTDTAVASITSETSRQAIGARITDEALKNNPVLKNVAGDQATNLVAGLLGTDQAEKLLTVSVSKLQVYVTSKNQQDVDIDLSGLKSTLTRVVEISGSGESGKLNPENIPDRIVLIEEENVPDLYSYGVVLNWLAVLGFLLAVALLAMPYLADRKRYLPIMAVQGALLALAGLVSLLVGPLFKPSVLEPFENANGRVVVSNLYEAFIATYNSQAMILIYLGLLLCLAAFVVKMIPQLKKLRK